MKDGNWIPLSKTLLKELPKGRPYSKVEAMFSLTVDYDCEKTVSLRGYVKLWGWHRKTVKKFIQDVGLEIKYFDKNHGKLSVPPSVPHGVPHSVPLKFIDSRGLGSKSVPPSVPKSDHPVSPTNNPKPNPKEKEKDKKEKLYPNWLDKVLWKEFKKMRVSVKKPLTEFAEKKAMMKLKALMELGYNQEEIVSATIEKCWLTFYEPKEKPKQDIPEIQNKWRR